MTSNDKWPGFLLALDISDLLLKRLTTQKCQSVQGEKTKQNSNKSLLSVAKGPGKGQSSKRESFQTVTTLAKHHKQNKKSPVIPHHSCQQRPSREPGLHAGRLWQGTQTPAEPGFLCPPTVALLSLLGCDEESVERVRTLITTR